MKTATTGKVRIGRVVLIAVLALVVAVVIQYVLGALAIGGLVAGPPTSVPTDAAVLFPLSLEYRSTLANGSEARHRIEIREWEDWIYTELDGDSQGYTIISDGTGRVIAGYDEWPRDEWQVQDTSDNGYTPLPIGWFRPYHRHDVRAYDQPDSSRAAELADMLGIPSADVEAHTSEVVGELVFISHLGILIYIEEPDGVTVELTAISRLSPTE